MLKKSNRWNIKNDDGKNSFRFSNAKVNQQHLLFFLLCARFKLMVSLVCCAFCAFCNNLCFNTFSVIVRNISSTFILSLADVSNNWMSICLAKRWASSVITTFESGSSFLLPTEIIQWSRWLGIGMHWAAGIDELTNIYLRPYWRHHSCARFPAAIVWHSQKIHRSLHHRQWSRRVFLDNIWNRYFFLYQLRHFCIKNSLLAKRLTCLLLSWNVPGRLEWNKSRLALNMLDIILSGEIVPVSQICNLTRCPLTITVRILKSTPIVVI